MSPWRRPSSPARRCCIEPNITFSLSASPNERESAATFKMTPFDFRPRTRVLFGSGEFSRLGEVARELGGTKCLLVADPGLVAAGYVQEATRTLKARRMEVFGFHDFDANPTTTHIEAGRAFAAPLGIDLMVGLGGGSSMDCAKGINFVLTNGGTMRDYWGYGKAP